MSLGLTFLQRGFLLCLARAMQKSTLHRAPLGVEAVLGGWVRSQICLAGALPGAAFHVTWADVVAA